MKRPCSLKMRRADWPWWVYAAVVIAAAGARLIERIQVGAGGSVSRFGPLFGAIILAVAVVAWRLRRAVMSVWLWRAVHAVVGLTVLMGLSYSAYLFAMTVPGPASVVLAATLLLLPASWALHHYSYRAPAIWCRRREER